MTGTRRLYFPAFAAQAQRGRAEIAVTDGVEPRDVTYGELAHASECVAAGLARLGAGPGARVAIAMEVGTTGIPKAAAMLQQGLWSSATASSASQLSSDAELWCTPLFHVGMAMLPLGALLAGARIRLLPRFDVDAVAAALAGDARPVTGMSVTYTLYRAIRDHPSFEDIPRATMRRIACGGASITAANCQQIRADWPASTLNFGYASTEFGRACSASFEELREHDFTGVGTPVAHALVSVRDDQGRPLPAGQEGWLTVRTPWSCDRYLNDYAQTAATWTAHGIRVGDVGVETRDGLPKQVRFYESLPRTGTGKVNRRFLRDDAAGFPAG